MPSKMRKLLVSLTILGNVYAVSDAYADQTLVSSQNVTIKASLDIGGDAFFLPNTNYGAGSYRQRRSGGYALIKDTTYGELYGKPILAGQWKTPWGFTVFRQASAIGSTTLGDGDAESLSQTTRILRAVTLEEANLGIDLPFNKEQKVVGRSSRLMMVFWSVRGLIAPGTEGPGGMRPVLRFLVRGLSNIRVSGSVRMSLCWRIIPTITRHGTMTALKPSLKGLMSPCSAASRAEMVVRFMRTGRPMSRWLISMYARRISGLLTTMPIVAIVRG